MKMKLMILLCLLFIPSVFAIEQTTRCLNSTYLETIVEWQECDDTCDDKNITQVVNCTMPVDSTERCDSTTNQCRHSLRSETGDVISFVSVTFMTGMFFFLGMRVQPAKEFSLFKNGLQILFFMSGSGCWFWILGWLKRLQYRLVLVRTR